MDTIKERLYKFTFTNVLTHQVCVSINVSKDDAIYDIDVNQGVDVDSKFWAYKIEVLK
jgi:hypothetical protein